jgi:hypothetical protein
MDVGTVSRVRTEMDDSILYQCNESELLEIARKQGLGRLRRGLSIDTLVKLVTAEIKPTTDHLSGTIETRAKLEAFIFERIEVTRSQLPGCDGRCRTYPCTEGRHALCFGANKDTV